MFDEAFRTLFMSKPAKLSHKNNNLIIHGKEDIGIPLRDIHTIVIDTPQITLTSSLMKELAQYKILVFFCDDSHLPSGVFSPFLAHYRSSAILDLQIHFSKQNKSILWQKIIQAKIQNQTNLLMQENKTSTATKLQALQKAVKLADGTNNEAKASALYFPSLFGRGFSRKDFSPINAALNYGYAIIRGCIARNLVGSGLIPSLGIFHSNQFNPFNLADDLIEPYRPFVDSRVLALRIENELTLSHRVELVNLLNTKVLLQGKFYPFHRSITRMVWSISNFICDRGKMIELPILDKESNGREVYESFSDV
ncbi:type II CRISPR-associated endonuclease Cas1 [Helicobacter mustelae]|uniref:CRISPR-associated endonuclease Cas1 n=1 Tax=Helicobacter mustelae (strain ATCC 43772 / CCUG 25715 / CIP 103759 / LMG 18044 / NCTC 12198 / R85-136P) TaxID=679897 RepID=D3UFL7_HELM1|nr:type II CRISPR-associated endonuclease Cas1 [Helicobacter mustelae]CBG39288.1 Putative CRISPR associated protein [Helicobacter mustelae 12198]SQH70799.1 CRISPR associated protein [Helicobacter mustelae]STP11924.1 CRISPR associated protein [Helicobacter mustelae]